MAGGFNANTRQKIITLPTQTRPTGGGITTLQLPKTGLLARLWLNTTGAVAGSLSNVNALGFSSIIRRIRLLANNGIAIVDISGPGYHWLMRDFLESEYIDIGGGTNGRTAVTATTYDISMMLPIQINMRDPLGLIMLQNEETIVTLEITWEADATVATGATVTGTCVPFMEFFTVPSDPQDWPRTDIIHQFIEDTQTISATTGQQLYYWPRGNTYLQMLHGYGFAVAGTGVDNWTQYQFRVNQSDYIMNVTPNMMSMLMYGYRGRARPLGTFSVDFMASSGLGNYGLAREYFNSALVTDIESVVTVSTSGTLYALRRQLVPLQGG